MHSL
jgi:eukaryotic-like serine/threonine-protein kinase